MIRINDLEVAQTWAEYGILVDGCVVECDEAWARDAGAQVLVRYVYETAWADLPE